MSNASAPETRRRSWATFTHRPAIDGVRAIAAIRDALRAAELEMEGWRCVLLVPAFADTLNRGRGIWRAILRMRAVVEAG